MSIWDDIGQVISDTIGSDFTIRHQQPVGGGCINHAYILSNGKTRFFAKLNTAKEFDMFAAEFAGLQEIQASGTIRVPTPVCCGNTRGQSFIILEQLHFGSGGSDTSLGQQLAAMHRTTRQQYGWHRNNTIGTTPQDNAQSEDWILFWRENRLAPQLALAANNGHRGDLQSRGELLLTYLPSLLADHQPPASLLHGDLWSGNYAFDIGGSPVIFDPAVYYGDREVDIAMTELFGGFSARFYHVYRDSYPLDDGYAVRKGLYNLYHVLNHLNLFGGGYLHQARHLIDATLAEVC